MSKKVANKPKLSFELDDEEENEEETFHVKKSKESRNFKKMRQAPGIMDKVIENAPPVIKSVSAEIGGVYSADNLAKLRQAQKFVKQEVAPEPLAEANEEMELCGEDAEEFVTKLEEMQKSTNDLGDYVKFDDKSADLASIHAARVANKALLKSGSHDARVYTSDLHKQTAPSSKNGNRKVLFDLAEEDNDSDWESEIIKRGVISSTTALTEGDTDVANKLSSINKQQDLKASGNNGSKGGSDITVSDLIKTVQMAVGKLSQSSENVQRKIAQITSELAQSQIEEATLRSKAETGVNRLNVAQVHSVKGLFYLVCCCRCCF
jgi:hypothetical protein